MAPCRRTKRPLIVFLANVFLHGRLNLVNVHGYVGANALRVEDFVAGHISHFLHVVDLVGAPAVH